MEAGVLQASRRRERLQLRRIRVAICGDARLCGTVLLSCACPLEKFLCSFLSSTLYHMVGYSFSDTPPDKSGGFLVRPGDRSEEHTSELQSPCNLVCRLLLEKKKNTHDRIR